MNTYELSNDHLKAKFTSLGGTLCSIQDLNGVEYLWQGEKEYWSGQAPVLFPICGSIRNDQAILEDGKIVTMPRHGIVRKKEFALVDQTKDTILFEIKSTKESYDKYPFDFCLYNEYKLVKNSIIVTYSIENKGKKKMPFQIGGHPGFRCPIIEGENYEDYEIEFEQIENCTVPTPVTETGLIDITKRRKFLENSNKLRLEHHLFHKDAVILDQLKSRKIKMSSIKSKKGVEMEFQDFPYLILWSSSNNGPFIAIEPWIGLSTCNDESDVFEEKRNMQIINPDETKRFSYSIMLL